MSLPRSFYSVNQSFRLWYSR